MTVPVSGEDQPDPRVELLAEEISDGYRNWGWADSCRSFDPSRARWRRHATEILHRLDEVDRAAGIRRVTEEQARVSFHVPQIGQRSDGRWGVFCAACSAAIGDYVYPCPTWAAPFNDYPAILSEVGGS